MRLALLVGMLVAAPPASAACVMPPASRVVKATPTAVVTVEQQDFDTRIDEKIRVWRGCAPDVGMQVELESGYSEFNSWTTIADRFELAGPFVAYRVASGDRHAQTQWLTLVDLRTGTRASVPRVATDTDGVGYVDHAVTSDGDLAWVRATYRGAGTGRWTVAVRRGGRTRRVHVARTRVTGLRLDDGAVRWRERGRTRSARA